MTCSACALAAGKHYVPWRRQGSGWNAPYAIVAGSYVTSSGMWKHSSLQKLTFIGRYASLTGWQRWPSCRDGLSSFREQGGDGFVQHAKIRAFTGLCESGSQEDMDDPIALQAYGEAALELGQVTL